MSVLQIGPGNGELEIIAGPLCPHGRRTGRAQPAFRTRQQTRCRRAAKLDALEVFQVFLARFEGA
jgi:hypothetical protein